uniref:Uncharacterized protein n=1 Tax=Anguilla anguilla TaxID=7936 RepID=A0A0E9VKC5_ANGAN
MPGSSYSLSSKSIAHSRTKRSQTKVNVQKERRFKTVYHFVYHTHLFNLHKRNVFT